MNASILRLYYTFIILNVLIFPTFLIGTLNGVANGFRSSDVIKNINFSLQGAFYINYVVQQTFFSGISRLLRPDDIFMYFLFRHMAVTDEEREEVKVRAACTMLYRIRFAQLLVVMACLLSFAVIVPLVLVTGIVYIIVIYMIDKNNLLHVFPKELAGDTSMTISVINMFMIAQILYEVLTAIFFYFKKSYWSFGVVVGLMGLTLLVMALLNFLNWYNKYRYIKYGKPLLIEWNLPQDLLENAYIHPGMVEEEGDLSTRLDTFVSGQGGGLGDLIFNPVDVADKEYMETAQNDDDFGEGEQMEEFANDEEAERSSSS